MICRSGPCQPASARASWRRISGLDQYAGGNYGQVSVAAPGSGSGTTVPAIGIDQLHGTGFLTLLAGRAPAGPRQITLGPRTLRMLGLHVGQRVRVTANGSPSMMRIVGSAVFAAFSVGGGSATDLGTGAAVVRLGAVPAQSARPAPACDLL